MGEGMEDYRLPGSRVNPKMAAKGHAVLDVALASVPQVMHDRLAASLLPTLH